MRNKIRDLFHVLIGFAISYSFFILFGLNKFIISWEYWNNALTPLIGAILSGGVGWIWEYYQVKRYDAIGDLNDVIRTAFGGLIGGIFAFCLVSQTLIIILCIISIILIIKDIKK